MGSLQSPGATEIGAEATVINVQELSTHDKKIRDELPGGPVPEHQRSTGEGNGLARQK